MRGAWLSVPSRETEAVGAAVPCDRDRRVERVDLYLYIREYLITGPVGTHFRTARCPRPSKPRVPSTAASGTAQPCRLDGSFVTRRRKGPVKVRGKTRKAFKHSRYMRLPLLVNPRSSASAADKVDQMSGELCLPASAHLIFTSSEHIFELEPSM